MTAPYAVLSLASALPALLVRDAEYASGFYIFALVNAVIYAAVFAVIVVQHARENAAGRADGARRPIMAVLALLLFGLPAFAASQNGLKGINSIVCGARYFTLTKVTFSVSGAGRSASRAVTLNPRWTLWKAGP